MPTSAPLLGEPWPVELMNTIWADREGVHDALDDPDDGTAWLERAVTALEIETPGSAPVRVDDDLRSRLRGLRDALRRLAADAVADPRTSWSSPTRAGTAAEELNEIAAAAPAWTALAPGPDGTLVRVTRSAHPVGDAAVSMLADQGARMFTDPGRFPLRACLGPGCVLYFVKQHPRREWCSPGCGNRARVARHYRRHRGD